MLDLWEGLDTLVVLDAAATGGPPGTLHRVDVHDEALPGDLQLASTHAVGFAEALELGRALGRAPRRVVVLAVEGRSFGMGDAMTTAVEEAIEQLVAAALAELGVEQ